MCTGAGSSNCDMTSDPFGGLFQTNCVCQASDPNAPYFELSTCGGNGVCSDGDPGRARAGYGWALGLELNTGNLYFQGLGPVVNGSSVPSTSPRYPIQNPPSVFDPQRLAGNVVFPLPQTGVITPVRTTDARLRNDLDAALGVEKLRGFGDSYWADWTTLTAPTTGVYSYTYA